MAAILARFKSEMGPIITYFTTFSTMMTNVSAAWAEVNTKMASISGQYTNLETYLSGAYAYSVVSGGFGV